MKKLLICVLSLLLITGVQACTNKSSDNNQKPAANTQTSEKLVQEYLTFIEQYDNSQMNNLRPDVTKPEEIQKDYKLINSYLAKAENLEARMMVLSTNSNDTATKLHLKPYMDTIKARIAMLKSNRATYLRMGAQ